MSEILVSVAVQLRDGRHGFWQYPRLMAAMSEAYFARWESLLRNEWDKAPCDGLCTFCGDEPMAGVRTTDGYRVCAACAADADNAADLIRVTL